MTVYSNLQQPLLPLGLYVMDTVETGNPIAGIRPFSDLKVGETVYAIGNPSPGPETTLTWSFTHGVISGLRADETIQIDAVITHGNSGGGLFDECGNLIGITAFGFKTTQGQGYNFAIAADKIWKRYAAGR